MAKRARRRFTVEDKLIQNTTPEGDCLVWTGSRKANGYGQSWRDGKPVYAHRMAWEQVHGPLGEAVLRHTCDNPPCVRLDHLVPGDQADNMRDKVSRGRQAQGVRAGNAILTDELAAEILQSELGSTALARLYGVSRGAIEGVLTRKTWKHVHSTRG